MPLVDQLEPLWPVATTPGVQRWARNHGIAPGRMDTSPTPGVDYAGGIFYTPGATGVADKMEVVTKDAADAYVLSSLSAPRVNVVDTAGVYATPIVLTAADSGKTYLLDDAAGLDFTLPAIAAADVGIRYTFLVATTVTSNAYRITAQSGDLFRGHVLISDFDAAYTAPQILAAEADESNDVIITIAVAASGGVKGGWFDLTAIHATGWFVRGNLLGDGTIVTIFS